MKLNPTDVLTFHISALLLVALCCFHHFALAGGAKVARGKTQSTVAGRQYDDQGRYSGRVDQSGNRFDSQGRYLGRTDSTGRQYDAQGRYLGRLESNGHQFDAQGRFIGRADSSGRLYDDQGRYQGRIDAEGRQFDTQGKYTGRLAATNNVPGSNGTSSTPSTFVKPEGAQSGEGPSAFTSSVEGSRAVAPFVFCNYGDKNCEN